MTDNQAVFTAFICCSGPLMLLGVLIIFRVRGVANLAYAIASIVGVLGMLPGDSRKPNNLVDFDDADRSHTEERVVGVFLLVLGIILLFMLPDMFIDSAS